MTGTPLAFGATLTVYPLRIVRVIVICRSAIGIRTQARTNAGAFEPEAAGYCC